MAEWIRTYPVDPYATAPHRHGPRAAIADRLEGLPNAPRNARSYAADEVRHTAGCRRGENLCPAAGRAGPRARRVDPARDSWATPGAPGAREHGIILPDQPTDLEAMQVLS